MRISGTSPRPAAIGMALCLALAACDGGSAAQTSRESPGLSEDQKFHDRTPSEVVLTPDGANTANMLADSLGNGAAADNAAPAAAITRATPVAVRDCSDGPDGCRGAASDLSPWVSAAWALGGFAAGALVTMLLFLLLRRKPEEEGENSPAVRRHYELVDLIGKLQYRSSGAPAPGNRPAIDRLPAGWTPPAPPPPPPPPPPAVQARQLGDISARFNAIAALPAPALDDYLTMLGEWRLYEARLDELGQLELGPATYGAGANVDVVAIALNDDAAALIPSFTYLERFRAGAPHQGEAGAAITAMFGIVADGTGRLKCARPAVVEHDGQALRVVPGQLSGFASD